MMKPEERRKHVRFPVMRNVGEPVELVFVKNHKRISLVGFILNLSAGGMRMVSLGDQATELALGMPFVMDIQLPEMNSYNVEGKIVAIQKSDKAVAHRESGEWFLSLSFTKVKPEDAKQISSLAEDWDVCETKISLSLPDVCFRECKCFNFCDKNVKLAKSSA